MTDETRVDEILGEWQLARECGVAATPEELIRQHPDLADELRQRLDVMRALDLMFTERSVAAVPLPTRIGPYELREELGTGGMGTVYLADRDGERVALKVLHPHLLERPGFFRRFQQEAAAGRAVDHPNVVRTLECDLLMVDGRPFHHLVMEFVEGRTLRDLLRDLGTVPEAFLREIARQVAAGLEAIHAAGIVHRDLKPANVLITPDHRVRIMDLGVARVLDASAALTREGEFAGTLEYAAPEQFRGGDVGPAADLYALGIVLYELATGANPFQFADLPAVMHAHLELEPQPAAELGDDVSPFLSQVIATLLAKAPAERLSSATELLELLTRGEESEWWREREQRSTSELPRIPVRRETRLHGRDADLELLDEAWRRACDGEGNVVLLEGEAGIGKTRLVDAFLTRLSAQHVHALYGSYPPSGGTGGLNDAVVAHFGRPNLAQRLQSGLAASPALIPAFAGYLCHEPAPEGAEPLNADALQAVFCRLLQSLAAERPAVWVVDDLHFATADSRAIVLSMARAAARHRVLLLLTARPGLPEEELQHFGRLENFRRRELRRLGAREVVELLRDAFKSELLADKLGVRVVYKSDGVPFFVFEMIRGLREGQFISELPDGSWVETRVIDRIEVPSAVRDLIEARLRSLSKEEREILDVGAVQGFEFGADLIGEVLERRKIAVLQDLAAVERRSGIVRSGGGAYRFDHHQIQEVLYQDLPEQLRTEYHALLGEAHEAREQTGPGADALAVTLCGHFLRGARGGRALRYLDTALEHLRSGHQNDDAVELLDAALGIHGLVSGDVRFELLLQKTDALALLGRTEDERSAIDEAHLLADELGDALLSARALRALGWLQFRLAKWDDAVQALERSVEAARTAGNRAAEGQAIGMIGQARSAQGRYEEARDHFESGVAIAREIGDVKEEAIVSGNIGLTFWREGRYAEAQHEYERALRGARATGDRSTEAGSLGNLGSVLQYQGQFAAARSRFEEQLEVVRRIGSRMGEASLSCNLGSLEYSSGRLARSVALTERFLDLSREIGALDDVALALQNLGFAECVLGRLDSARAHVEEALELARRLGFALAEGLCLWSLAGVAQTAGDTPAAEHHCAEAIATFRRIGARDMLSGALGSMGSMMARRGRHAEAREALQESLSLAESLDVSGTQMLAACGLARLPGGDVAAALAVFARVAPRAEHDERMEACFSLWQITGHVAHLRQAHDLLATLRSEAPEADRDTMIENVPLHRDIVEAWEEHGSHE